MSRIDFCNAIRNGFSSIIRVLAARRPSTGPSRHGQILTLGLTISNTFNGQRQAVNPGGGGERPPRRAKYDAAVIGRRKLTDSSRASQTEACARIGG